MVRRPARFCFVWAFWLKFVLRSLVNIPRQMVGTDPRGRRGAGAGANSWVPTSWTCKRGIQSVAASPSLHLTRSWC